MALRLTFSEQNTGIVTSRSGQCSLGAETFQQVARMQEALALAREHLELHPDHEAWIGSSVSTHRLTLPSGGGFASWMAQYKRDGSLGPVRPGLTYGEVVTMPGWPDQCSHQLKRSPMAVILRYGPGDVDFHFDDGGRLWLIHQDDCDNPETILSAR